MRPSAYGTTPLTSTPFWRTAETRWCSAILTPNTPPGSPEQEMTGQRPEGKISTGRSTVRNSVLQTKTLLPGSPPKSSPPHQISSLILSGHLLPEVTWPTLTTLGSDRLPIIISLFSHAPPSLRKARSFTNFRKAGWEGFTAETERNFANTPLPTPCSAGGKSLQAYPR